ncbi:snoaL-like domain-containing [Pyrenophora seminiperda CCB06]|uniref:SnoaL-like domain-containing n=1 Tax=Pyrenophora seminiperda CCB06 TaxID=1302712 RepID=A0A3M7LZL6_9PLEO|nr:snoaL-like domain-containing [Pyrenophora seminiperda CCB06]
MISKTFRAAAITVLALLTPSIAADGADAASWPTGINVAPGIKENIKALYRAVNDPKGSLAVAATFTPNGSFVENGMTFEGHTEISTAIASAYNTTFLTQNHTIFEAYAIQSPGLNLMLRGSSRSERFNGSIQEEDFVAWVTTSKVSLAQGEPKIERLQVFH